MHGNSATWEIRVPLKAGYVKFRSRNSWTENWGGNAFPSGRLMFFGEDILIAEDGYYRVTLDLENSTYLFSREEP